MQRAKITLVVLLSFWLSGCVLQMAYQQRQKPCDSCPLSVADDPQERANRHGANSAMMGLARSADMALWSFATQAIANAVSKVADDKIRAAESAPACGANEEQICSTAKGCWCKQIN